MSKKKLQGIALILALICFAPVACHKEKPETPAEPSITTVGDIVELWSAPNNVKVTKTDAADDELDLRVEMAANEYEGVQLIMTAKKPVESYTVSVSDLTMTGDASKKIDKSNISVFNQHYIQTTEPSGEYVEPGWYPDALVPYDLAVEAGENTISLLDNQGLWFTIYAPKGTAAGTYTGTVTLTVNGKTENIPLTAEVWDFELSDENELKTLFTIWTHPMPVPFLEDGFGLEPKSDIELYRSFYDFLLEYRINSTFLPNYSYEYYYTDLTDKDKEAALKEQMMEDIIRATDDIRVNSYTIPIHITEMRVTESRFLRVMRDIAERAIEEEKNLFEKAQFYVAEVDEPGSEAAQQNVVAINKQIYDLKRVLANDTTLFPDGDDSEGIVREIRDSLLGIYNVVTKEIVPILDLSEEQGGVTCWCPQIQHFQNNIEEYQARQENGAHVWYYTCESPDVPYPTYHIDDPNLMGGRLTKWMAYEYGWEGELYWGVNIWKKLSGTAYVDKDPWVDPLTYTGCNGDGALTYPGAKYGYKGAIPTVKLEAHRDGMEDYAYLKLLESGLAAANAVYNTDVTVKDVLKNVYPALYSEEVIPTTDSGNLIRARREVAGMIMALRSDARSVVTVADKTDAGYAVTVRAAVGTSVKVNDTELTLAACAGGVSGSTTVDAETIQITVSNGDTTISFCKFMTADARIEPTISVLPAAAALNYGQTLRESAINGGTTSVPGKFVWVEPNIVPEVGSGVTYRAKFLPNDTETYKTVYFDLPVTVYKSVVELTVDDAQLVQNIRTFTPVTAQTNPVGITGALIEYKPVGAADTAYTPAVPTTAGTYMVRATLDNENCSAEPVEAQLILYEKDQLGVFEQTTEGWFPLLGNEVFIAEPVLSLVSDGDGGGALQLANKISKPSSVPGIVTLANIGYTIDPNKITTLTMRVRTDAVNSIAIYAFNASGTSIIYDAPLTIDAWTDVSVDISALGDLSQINLQFLTPENGEYAILLDDVFVVESDWPNELVIESFGNPADKKYASWGSSITEYEPADWNGNVACAGASIEDLPDGTKREQAGFGFDIISDWSQYDYLQIDVLNNQYQDFEVYLRIGEEDYRIGTAYNNETWTTLTFDLSRLSGKSFIWFALYHKITDPDCAERNLAYKNLRLVKASAVRMFTLTAEQNIVIDQTEKVYTGNTVSFAVELNGNRVAALPEGITLTAVGNRVSGHILTVDKTVYTADSFTIKIDYSLSDERTALAVFEDGLEGWTPLAENPTYPATPALTTAEDGRNGSQAMKITVPAGSGQGISMLQNIDFSVNEAVVTKLTMWLKAREAQTVEIAVFNENDTTVWPSVELEAGVWKEVSIDISSFTKLRQINFITTASAESGREILMDDVYISVANGIVLESFADGENKTYAAWGSDVTVYDPADWNQQTASTGANIWNEPGRTTGGFSFEQAQDWTRFHYLQVDVLNNQDQNFDVFIRVNDADYKMGTAVNNGQWTTLTLDIQALPDTFLFFQLYHEVSDAASSQRNLTYSNLRLLI